MPELVGSLADGQTFVRHGGDAQARVAAHSSGGADASTVYLTTRPDVLQPGVRYQVRVQYEVVSQPKDRSHFLYLVVRGGAAGSKWFPLIELPTQGESVQDNGYEFIVPDDGVAYHVEIGRRGAGQAMIDAAVIERLPTVARARESELDLAGLTVPQLQLPYEPYGMCVHADRLWSYSDADVERAVRLWAQAGIQWVRLGMGWGQFEPREDGGWSEAQVARIDRLVALCVEYGVRPYFIVGGTPRWASTQPDHAKWWAYSPRDLDRYRAFVRFVARRYGEQVKVWEIGNEPNWGFWLDDMPSFMRLARAAAEVIREEVPQATILNGGLADAGLVGMRLGAIQPVPDALAQMAAHGFADTFDVMAIHVYADSPEEMLYRINHYYAQMVELGLAHMPMWITETGLSTVGGRTEQQQADWVSATYDLLLQHPCVEKVFYYNFRMKTREESREANFGIVDGDLQPRPAYDAYRSMPKRSAPLHDPVLLAVDRWRWQPATAASAANAK